MDDRNNWDEWIQAYIDGDLNSEETIVFQQQLMDSASFSQRFKEYQESLLQLKAVQFDRLRSDMKAWAASDSSNTNSSIRPLIWLASAAMVILLVVAGSWVYLGNQYRAEALLSSAMDYKVDEIRERGTPEGPEGLIALSKQDYARAILNLPAWVDQDGKTTPKAYLYMAKAHIGLNQFDSATYYLDLLTQIHHSQPDKLIFWEEVPWYQALVALGLRKRALALSKLEEVIRNDAYHKTDALALKAKLESNWYSRFN